MPVGDRSPTGIPASTVEEQEIGKYMRSAWAAFAKDPVNGLDTYGGGWPRFDPENEMLVRLVYMNTGTNLGLPADYDAACGSIFPVVTT